MAANEGTEDRDEELEALRQQVETLKSEAEGGKPRTRRRWGRGLGALALLVIGGILLPMAASAVWADRLVSSTDRYVQTVSPLAEDPAMQAAITNRIVTEIQQYVDVEDLTTQALDALGGTGRLDPRVTDQLKTLAGPVSSGIENFVRDQVAKIVASPEFAQAWDEANKIAHTQLVAVLTGKDTTAVTVDDGKISLNLGAFITVVKQKLVDNGFGLASNIPAVNVQFVIFESDDLAAAQTAFKGLNVTAWVLPLLVLLLFAGAVLLAPSRRLGFLGVGVTVVIAMAIALAALSVGRIIYLNNIPTDVLPGGAAGSVFDILTRFLKQGLRAMFFFGLVTAVAALLAGPSRGAVAVRGAWVGGLQAANQWLRSIGLRTEPIAAPVESNALLIRVLLVIAGAAVLVLWDYPTPKVALWITFAVLVGLAVVDFLRAPVDGSRAKKSESAAATS